jgi:hypothetical protein
VNIASAVGTARKERDRRKVSVNLLSLELSVEALLHVVDCDKWKYYFSTEWYYTVSTYVCATEYIYGTGI